MKNTDRLFELIQSLSKNEKGYFMKMTAGEKPQYIYLFKALDKLDSYDEEKLVKKLKKYVEIKHLSSTKSYLYHLILKTLRTYKARTSLHVDILGQIQDIEFLHHKGFHQECLKKIKHLKQTTWESGIFSLYFYLSDMETRSINYYYPAKTLDEKGLLEIFKQLEESCQEYVTFIQGRKTGLLALKSFHNKRFEHFSKKTVNEWLSQLAALGKRASHNWTKSIIHDYKSIICSFSVHHSNYDTMKHIKKTLNILRKNPQLQEAHPKDYAHAHVLYTCLKSEYYMYTKKNKKKTTQMVEQLNVLRLHLDAIKHKISFRQFALMFVNMHISELRTHRMLGMHSEVDILIKKSKSTLQLCMKNSRSHKGYNFIWLSMTIHYFETENYHKAIECLDKIIENPDHVIKGLYVSARIVHVLCHFELKHSLYLPSAVRSLYRYIRAQETTTHFEKSFVKYMNKILKTTDKEDMIELFIQFRTELENLRKDPKESEIIDYFPHLVWLTSKIENKSFAQVAQEVHEKEWVA